MLPSKRTAERRRSVPYPAGLVGCHPERSGFRPSRFRRFRVVWFRLLCRHRRERTRLVRSKVPPSELLSSFSFAGSPSLHSESHLRTTAERTTASSFTRVIPVDSNGQEATREKESGKERRESLQLLR